MAFSTTPLCVPFIDLPSWEVLNAMKTYFETFPLNVTEALPIFATSTDTTVVDDACNPLPDSTPDLSGFLTVIRRGTCTFVRHNFSILYAQLTSLMEQVQKLTNAAAKGAQIVFIYE